jgi:hypothetical protein
MASLTAPRVLIHITGVPPPQRPITPEGSGLGISVFVLSCVVVQCSTICPLDTSYCLGPGTLLIIATQLKFDHK